MQFICALQALVLDAIVEDPDGTADGRVVTFKWTASNNFSTYDVLPGLGIAADGPSIYVAPWTLEANNTYVFNLTASKQNTTDAVAQMVVQVFDEPVPQVSIISGQLGEDFLYVDYTRTLTLLGYGDYNATIYKWSLRRGEFANGLDIDENTVADTSHAANTNRTDLSLRAGCLFPDAIIFLRLSAKFEGGIWGKYSCPPPYRVRVRVRV